MRKLNFDNKSSFELLDMKNHIQRLILDNYTIERIENLLGITKHQFKLLLKYKFIDDNQNFQQKENDITEKELIFGAMNYTYEDLSDAEKEIFNNLRR